MSALLQNDAVEINLNAEYGMCGRRFNKAPRVYQSDKFTSALFLVYSQNKMLPNRVQPLYRNHFTLFSNATSIVIARTETTLVHDDNDAVIMYDVITPSVDNVQDRRRSKYKRWQVSFDKITYSNKAPASFVGYTLLCSGEFWYFDKGIVLNGLSSYELEADKNQFKSYATLIYYELHVDHLIRQNNQTAIFPPPIQIACSNGSNGGAGSSDATPQTNVVAPSAQQRNNNNNNLLNPLLLQLSSLSANLLPRLNATVQPVIRHNDNVCVPEFNVRMVVPTLHWFDERQNELDSGSIEYFRPHNYTRPSFWK